MSSRPSSTAHSQPIAPTVPSAIHILASPTPILLDANLPNYLLPQLISSLRDSAAHVLQRRYDEENKLREDGLIPGLPGGKGKGRAVDHAAVEAETMERVQRIGVMVGGYIAEKLTVARAPLANHLDIIKFICKDLFLYVYSKQIDNLRTNHRGTFVLQSHIFPPIASLSSHRGTAADLEAAKIHLVFPQALMQGALTRLGMPAYVTAETTVLPQCTFQIRTVKSTQTPGGGPGPTGTGTPALSTPAPPALAPPPPAAVAGSGSRGHSPAPGVMQQQQQQQQQRQGQGLSAGLAGLGIGGQ